jgi:hypothetical protein
VLRITLALVAFTGPSLFAQDRSADPTCFSPASFADGKIPARIRHVAVTGDDTRGDGSAAAPFQTIARAAQGIEPGTAIHVHAGIHRGGVFLTNLQGTPQQPIWIMGAPGEARPVLEGGSEGLRLVKPRYLIVRNLEIRGTADNGINADDGDDVNNPEAARGVVFQNLDIHDTGRRPSGVPNCLKLAGVNNVLITNSRFARCGIGPESGAVGVGGVGVRNATVAFSEFSENGYGGVQFKGGSADIVVAANRFTNTGWRGVNMGGSTGAPFFRPPLSSTRPNAEARNIRVFANVFEGGEAAAAFTGCVACAFSHNTVVNPSRWVLRILQETVTAGGYTIAPAGAGSVVGNIFYFRRADLNTGEDINVGPNTNPDSFRLSGNLWFAYDQPDASAPRLPAFRGLHAGGRVGADPRFVNVDAGDFRLRADSPARNAGGNIGPDYDFTGRCYSAPFSLGAFAGQ